VNERWFSFAAADKNLRSIIHSWMAQEHVQEWIYGECLKWTLDDLDAFLSGKSLFQHWVAYDGETPFGYLLTSDVIKNGDDEYAQFCTTQGRAITLDVLIGNVDYLGKGMAHRMIKEFLLSHCTQTDEVLIDPDVKNLRAVHVYEKAGFRIVNEFIPAHSTLPHYIMHLRISDLKRDLFKNIE